MTVNINSLHVSCIAKAASDKKAVPTVAVWKIVLNADLICARSRANSEEWTQSLETAFLSSIEHGHVFGN